MPTNTKESGLETLIVNHLVEHNGFEQGTNDDYNREYALDETRLFRFLEATQPKQLAKLGLPGDALKRAKFLTRLRDEITKRGIVDVLRKGVKVYPADLILFYMTPSEKNEAAKKLFAQNIFSVTRQLAYSADATKKSLDLVLFVNGLPILTCELKNRLTGQNVDNAVHQYRTDRDPNDLLLRFTRCMAHFAVDDAHVKFCTKLEGEESWFLPFDRGCRDGAGNPPNPDGLMTDYLWKDIFTKARLANIIENYAQTVEETDPETGRKSLKQIFPRYHQLAVVSALLAEVRERGVGGRYLIQHSAGSGKSNSIAWLAHQLVELEKDGENLVDSVVVVTDRVNLDRQIRDTIKQFTQVASVVAWAEHAADLRRAIAAGKKIIITTVHKFPYILDGIGADHRGRRFAVIIDEAHSSQSGSLSAQMNAVISGEGGPEDGESVEDMINRLMESRRMPANASFFAFTATPKNKTLEMFGKPLPQPDGTVKHAPFHNYSMKQAIQEGFIMDVLKCYTPVASYYRLAKAVEDDPLFDRKKAHRKLRAFVQGNAHTLARKAEIMVEHFLTQVIAKGKIGGRARAMVVTGGIAQAIEYYRAITRSLESRRSPYRALVAFSGEKDYGGETLDEAKLNGFPGNKIEREFRKDPYRFLVVADKFQTGYDEPLLHTMYVDKVLTDIKAVQTLSRLNRARPGKFDTFVLDFANDADVIAEAFSRYYRATILSGETDPNKLHDLIADMERHQVYAPEAVEEFIGLYLGGASRDRLDPILDACAKAYMDLDLDGQIGFKGAAKSFVRTYGFLGAILPYGNAAWEKLSIFLNLLLPKLPSPVEDDLSVGIIEAIDLDSYRVEAQNMVSVQLEDGDAVIDPVPTGSPRAPTGPDMDPLTEILNAFNDLFGNIAWTDADNVRRQVSEIPAMVAKDERYRNAMKNSDEQNARLESDRALQQVIFGIMTDNMELFKQFQDNPSFKQWLSDTVFAQTYRKGGGEG